MYTKIQEAQINEVVQKLLNPDLTVVGIDTEFMRTHTFWPILCLIQIAINDEIFIVDPIEVNASPILEALDQRRDLLKIFHSGEQDLEAFAYLYDVILQPVFDTQIAASFCGFRDSIGYKDLVQKMLMIDIDKTEQKTNWEIRPLSEEQILYAANDARYLVRLYNLLTTRPCYKKNADLVQNVMAKIGTARLSDDELYGQKFYKPKVKLVDFTIQKYIALWRERYCKSMNILRGDVISNDEIATLHEGINFDDFLPNNKNREILFAVYSQAQKQQLESRPKTYLKSHEQGNLLNKLKKDIRREMQLPLRFIADRVCLIDFLFSPEKANCLLEGAVFEHVGRKLMEKYYNVKVRLPKK